MTNVKLKELLDWINDNTNHLWQDKYKQKFSYDIDQPVEDIVSKIESLMDQPSKVQITDPWCYDLDKAPEEVHILIYLGYHYVIQAFKDEKGLFRHSYSGLLVTNDKNIKAWMLIPKPSKWD